jgi:hypothetical protein
MSHEEEDACMSYICHIYIYIYMTCIYIYIYIHAYTHMYTHTGAACGGGGTRQDDVNVDQPTGLFYSCNYYTCDP